MKQNHATIMKTPFISVIITCHSRKEFLLEAIKSVLAQGLTEELYELVVVKNFEDPWFDGYLSSIGSKNILCECVNVGAKIVEGIKHASGEVLCLLDDDDRFIDSKLSIIYNKFTEDNNLGYYHNSHSVIDEKGNQVAGDFVKQSDIQLELSSEKGLKKKIVKALRNSTPDFNNSSITMRKEAILPFLDPLSKIKITSDIFLFTISFLSKKSIIIDNLKLTQYRVHNSSVNELNDLGSYIDRNRIQLKDFVNAQTLMMSIAQNSDITFYVRYKLLEYNVRYFVFSELKNSKDLLINCLKLIIYSCIFYSKTNFLLSISAPFTLLSSSFLRKKYYEYFRKKKAQFSL